jgi:hypothetical protein
LHSIIKGSLRAHAGLNSSHENKGDREMEHSQGPVAAGMRQTPAWRLISGGICWVATLEFFAAQAIAQAAWKGSGYSLAGNAISDLGVTACGRITIAGQPGY